MLRLLIFPALVLIISCSGDRGSLRQERDDILNVFSRGEFRQADSLIQKALLSKKLTTADSLWLVRRQATIERIRIDFSKTSQQVKEQLARYYPVLADSLMERWEQSGHLEMRRIDGEKRYFKNAVPNLFRINPEARSVRESLVKTVKDPLDSICLENIREVLSGGQSGKPAAARIITIDFAIDVDADAVPAGETIRCWLPFPADAPPRQTRVRLISSDPKVLVQSTPNDVHSSLYVEARAVAGQPTRFSYTASFEISGQHYAPGNLVTAGRLPDSLKQWVSEQPPHIVFSDRVRSLADSLAGNEENPFRLLKTFWYWIDENIPWTSALEYSTFESIPDYVLSQRHGDCGMKTFLLISLARCKGIPARWQSGWMLHPGKENLHDWCEVWFAGTGWIPVDPDFGVQSSEVLAEKEFYLSGIDSYRMIVNRGISGDFTPAKRHYRSEPFDFQRGEVEWRGGNLYFTHWDYNLNVISIENKSH